MVLCKTKKYNYYLSGMYNIIKAQRLYYSDYN